MSAKPPPENLEELPQGEGPVEESFKEKIVKGAEWFLPAVGLIYASGFLIVFTFFKSFGINSVDFIEAKYIHIGSLFVMSCVVVILPTTWLLWLIGGKKNIRRIKARFRDRKFWKQLCKTVRQLLFPDWKTDSKHGIHTTVPGIGSTSFMLWAFIFLITFAPPDFAYKHPDFICYNFLFPLVILILAFLLDLQKHSVTSTNIFLKGFRFVLRLWWIGWICYILIELLFADTVPNLAWLLRWLFGYSLLGITLFRIVFHCLTKNKNTRRALNQWFLYAIQWLLFVSQFGAFIFTIKNKDTGISLRTLFFGGNAHLLRGYWSANPFRTWHFNFPAGAIYFMLFMLLVVFFGFRSFYRLNQIGSKDKSHRMQLKIGTACVLTILFYFSVLSFARFIYPYIPAGKGGGDYTLSQPVQITFDSAFTNSIPQPVKDGIQSNNIILLDENGSFAFFANLNDGGGRETWRTANKPTVYEIRREAIISITYFNPVVTNQNKNTNLTNSPTH